MLIAPGATPGMVAQKQLRVLKKSVSEPIFLE
jgi:hypothetical protein